MIKTFQMIVLMLFILSMIVLGCGSGKDAAEPTADAPSGEVKTADTPAVETPKDDLQLDSVKMDEEVVAAVKSAMSCDLNSSITYKCDAYKKAMETLKKLVKDEVRISGFVETLSALVHDKDPKLQGVSMYMVDSMSSLYIYPKLAKKKDAISEVTARRFMKALADADEDMALRVAKSVTYLVTIAGIYDPLYGSIEGLKVPQAKYNSVSALMTYGRSNTFAKVQEMAKGEDMKMRKAALESARNMPKWNDDEAKAVCPWAASYIQDPDIKVAAVVAHLMVKCKRLDDGKYIVMMLDEGKRRVEAGQWTKPFVWAYRDVCFGGFFGTDKKASNDLCQKTYDFLEWVANQEKVEAWHRGFALSMIYYQRRDQVTFDLLKKYKKSKVKEIKEMVEKDMESLKKNYLDKKK